MTCDERAAGRRVPERLHCVERRQAMLGAVVRIAELRPSDACAVGRIPELWPTPSCMHPQPATCLRRRYAVFVMVVVGFISIGLSLMRLFAIVMVVTVAVVANVAVVVAVVVALSSLNISQKNPKSPSNKFRSHWLHRRHHEGPLQSLGGAWKNGLVIRRRGMKARMTTG